MGPLAGIRVIEIGGIGPVPFCGMMLGDMGASVVRIERASAHAEAPAHADPLLRNRRSVAIDLKNPAGAQTVLALCARAEILIEGFRPGVMERLGLAPERCLDANPRLVYGRMTGWGQSGPLASSVGHDIDYLALSGALHLIGPPRGKPVPPLNLVGDFGGGGMLLLSGVLAALLEARTSGRGQVVDAAMIDGIAAQLAMHFGFRAAGAFVDATGENLLAGGAPYYDTYRTRDGKYVAMGAIEPEFYAALLERLGLDRERFGRLGYPSLDAATRARWPELRSAIAEAIGARTREECCRLFEGSDACVAPVLGVAEALRHPHHLARGTFTRVEGVEQNAPAPRFSRTASAQIRPPRRAGEDTEEVLREAGLSADEIARLRAAGALT